MRKSSQHLVEMLTDLGHQYRHFQQEHEREGARSATRHTLSTKMRQLEERFARLLDHWVGHEKLRLAWIQYFHQGGVPPSEPKVAKPPVFRGVTESGSRIEVQARNGGYDLIVDGSIDTRQEARWQIDPRAIEPIQIGRYACRETDEAPPESLRALAEFLATPGAEPPWQWLRALYEDGLVDGNFGLTARGQRRLRSAAEH
jgi:hypothetical protein